MDRPTATECHRRPCLAGLVSWVAEYALCLRIDKRAVYGLRITRSTTTSILLTTDDSLVFIWINKPRKLSVESQKTQCGAAAPSCTGVRARLG